MTSETTLAWTQTIRALCDLCEDLLKNFQFDYVLTGKLQSDPLEARFGCYRQLNGANFFVSVRQLLDSEKKIRVLNRLKDMKDAVESGVVTTLASFLPNVVMTCNVEYLWLATRLHCCVESIEEVPLKKRNIFNFLCEWLYRKIHLPSNSL
ncbi:MAG: hypothetical protein AAGK05_12630 [Pseudomonadota bacterium]